MIFDVIFSDFFGWDWGTPAILRQNPNKITVWNGCGFCFKKLGLGETSPPPWDKNPHIDRKLVLEAPLTPMCMFFLPKYNHRFVIVHYFTLTMCCAVNANSM